MSNAGYFETSLASIVAGVLLVYIRGNHFHQLGCVNRHCVGVDVSHNVASQTFVSHKLIRSAVNCLSPRTPSSRNKEKPPKTSKTVPWCELYVVSLTMKGMRSLTHMDMHTTQIVHDGPPIRWQIGRDAASHGTHVRT